MNPNMTKNRFSSKPRPHLFQKQTTMADQEPSLLSKTSSRKFLALSKDFSRSMGITIQRRSRMSIDKLYDEKAFSFYKNQQSSKHTSSTATMTKAWSPKSVRGSTHLLSSLSSSKVSNILVSINPQPESASDLRKQEVLNTYYVQQEPVRNYVHKFQNMLKRPIQGESLGVKKYDIRRLVRFG